MKILHVLYSGLGGHGNVFFSLVNADKDHDFTYEVIFTGIEEVRQEYTDKCNQMGIQWSYIKKKPGIDIKHFTSLTRAIKKSDAGIIFLHSSSYILPCWLGVSTSGKKKIIIRETQANNLKSKKEWRWLSLSFLLAKKIVFLSGPFNKEVEKRISQWYKRKKVAIIPNGIDLTVFHPGSKKETDRIRIGMQSRLTANKDHNTLLHAFALVKSHGYNVELAIAGDGEYRNELMNLAQQLKVDNHVEFTGMLAEAQLVEFLHQLNIYVHASLGETMSTAIMQAMACRLPVIASDVPGINNMISHNSNGLLVPVKDKQSLCDAIILLIKNRALAHELGINAYRQAMENYSNTVMFNAYKELFTQ